jgi:hypothetical protein
MVVVYGYKSLTTVSRMRKITAHANCDDSAATSVGFDLNLTTDPITPPEFSTTRPTPENNADIATLTIRPLKCRLHVLHVTDNS